MAQLQSPTTTESADYSYTTSLAQTGAGISSVHIDANIFSLRGCEKRLHFLVRQPVAFPSYPVTRSDI